MTARFRVVFSVLVALSILTVFLAGLLANRMFSFQLLRERFGEVDVSDGVQSDEADLIVSEYLYLLLGPAGACGGTADPALADGTWKVEILFGFGGERTGRWISVDSIHGGVTSPGGPSYADFGSFRRARLLSVVVHGR